MDYDVETALAATAHVDEGYPSLSEAETGSDAGESDDSLRRRLRDYLFALDL